MAAPTSADSGSRLCPLPWRQTRSCPWSLSMSSSASLMTSQARSSSRIRSSSKVPSRRPTAVTRSQLSMARSAYSAAIALEVGGRVVHVATAGTPAASPAGPRPGTHRSAGRPKRQAGICHANFEQPSTVADASACLRRRCSAKCVATQSAVMWRKQRPGRPLSGRKKRGCWRVLMFAPALAQLQLCDRIDSGLPQFAQ